MDTRRIAITPSEADFIESWALRFPEVLAIWVFGSRVALGLELAGDLDVLFILDREPEPSWLRELKSTCAAFKQRFNTYLDPMVISLPTLWHKLTHGDVQMITILGEALPLHELGLFDSLHYLVQGGTIKADPAQLPALLDFANKNMALATDGARLPIRRLVYLRTAARSIIQALCLRDNRQPPPPRAFPELVRNCWIKELGSDSVREYCEFESVVQNASRQRSATSELLVIWLPRIAQLVSAGVAACSRPGTRQTRLELEPS